MTNTNDLLAPIAGAGTIPDAAVDYVRAQEWSDPNTGLHRTILTLTSLPITTNGGATNAIEYGGVKVYDFPLGIIRNLGGIADLTIAMDGTMSAYFNDATPEGDVSIGSSIVDSAAALGSSDLSDDDFVGATAYTMAAYAVATAVKGKTDAVTATETFIDGRTTATDANVNLTVDASERDATTALTLLLSGTIVINWLLVENF